MAALGDTAPDVAFTLADGSTATLAKWRGKPLVLFFYPKDDTTGCTRESKDFSTSMPAFEAAGVAVLGASRDSVASHAKFTAKYALSVPLAADTDGALTEAFGVWVEKSMYGRIYMGIERAHLPDRRGRPDCPGLAQGQSAGSRRIGPRSGAAFALIAFCSAADPIPNDDG